MGRLLKDFPRWTWPQDDLQSPTAGRGLMPPLDRANRIVSKAQSFTMTTEFAIGALTPDGTQITNTIPTDQDGDFWVDQIYLDGAATAGGVVTPDVPMGNIQIIDARSNKRLTNPFIPIAFLRGGTPNEFTGYNVDSQTFPSGFRSTALMVAPFCFTRQGAITVIYTQDGLSQAATTYTITLSLGGWKEYADAAR